jgi:tape measure domain-containing protein
MAKGLTVKIRADASQFEKTMRGVKGTLRGITPSFTAIAATAAAAGASIIALGYGIYRMVKSASQEAAKFETLSAQMEVLTGSAANAKKLLDELTTFGATTPLEQGDLQQASKTLLGFGITLDNIMPTLRMLGDVSMGNGQTLQQLALVFGQITSAGRLMGQDVLQLINAGFNPLVQISKRTGESMLELKKRMEAGGISSDEVAQAFKDATSQGGLFEGMLAKIAETTDGKISNLNDTIAKLKRSFGIGFNEGLKVALDAANEKLPKLEAAFKTAGDNMGNALTDAVSGNYTKMIAMGEFVAELIAQVIKVGLSRAFLEITESTYRFLEDINPLRKMFPSDNKISDYIAQNKGQYTRSQITDSVSNMKKQFEALSLVMNRRSGEVEGTLGGRFRYGAPGEQSVFRDAEGRVLMDISNTLMDIKRNTQPQLFPAQ